MRDDDTVITDRQPTPRRNVLWWVLPLLLLLLVSIGLLYYFMIYKNNKTAADTQAGTSDSTAPSAQTQTNSGTVTDLATLLSTSDPSSLIGKKVDLPSAIVDQVIGDKSFTLGAPTDYIYAVLSDQLDSGQTEQAIHVQAGETRSIKGVVVKAPDDMDSLMDQFQLSHEQADEPRFLRLSQPNYCGQCK